MPPRPTRHPQKSYLLVSLVLCCSATTVSFGAPPAPQSTHPSTSPHALSLAPRSDTQGPQAAIQRLLPHHYRQFTLTLLPAADIAADNSIDNAIDKKERFEISGLPGHIQLAGSSPSALLASFNWYLKYVANAHISTNGDQLHLPVVLPAPPSPIKHSSLYPHRFALNQTATGYAAPYWDWPRWQREIDVMAISGINEMLVYTGTEQVLYQTFLDFGYSDAEMRAWITMPAHQPWQQMGNISHFGGPISRELLKKRVALGQQIVARLRELGITPVFPGYYGMVPSGFATKLPQAHVVTQGDWNGFQRPDWLDPRDPLFGKVAATFYRHEQELFGSSTLYEMDLFQEGGRAGGVPVADAGELVQQALTTAHPTATWAMLGWLDNPKPELLTKLRRQSLLILDLGADRYPDYHRERQWADTPRAFGALWEFGGKGTIGANLPQYAVRMPTQRTAPQSTLRGIAVMPESWDNNPAAFDLVTEMAWHPSPVDLPSWIESYAVRRYGASDSHVQKAWSILLHTVYSTTADGSDEQSESLFNAQPSLDAVSASTWAAKQIRYDAAHFEEALPELLAAAPALQHTETYRYDLVTVARQVLANRSHQLLPAIKVAYLTKDRSKLQTLTQNWLQLMHLQDNLLATDQSFLLGDWLAQSKQWASNETERRQIEYDARSLLSSWGNRAASESGLHDYANKDWAGITEDLYAHRWQLYFASLDQSLATSTPPKSIDWFAVDETWNHAARSYPHLPTGDTFRLATKVCHDLLSKCSTP